MSIIPPGETDPMDCNHKYQLTELIQTALTRFHVNTGIIITGIDVEWVIHRPEKEAYVTNVEIKAR